MGAARMKVYNGCAILLFGMIVFGSLMAAASTGPTDMSTAILVRVDQSGINGDFKKIQDAIDSVPSNNSELYFIWVKPGTYRYVRVCICGVYG